MTNTDHQISKTDAKECLACQSLPREFRVMYLQKFRGDRTVEDMIELLADWMGLTNQIVANNRKHIEGYLVTECGHTPDIAATINLPDVSGALIGIVMAVKPKRGICGTCAFRSGSVANQCHGTLLDAEGAIRDREPSSFNCHEHMENGNPTRICAGAVEAMR